MQTAPDADAGFSKTQKLAGLLVMLGSETAANVLKQFPSAEIESISREMARFGLISREQQQEILREFSDVALAASTAVSAGVDYTRNTLERALGTSRAGDVIGRVSPPLPASGAMQIIADMDPRHIANLVRDEQMQTIAFVVSHLHAEKSAQVLALLNADQHDKVIERLAMLAPTPIEVTEKVVAVLNSKLGVKQTRALTQTGGITTAADILNAMDKNTSRALLTAIEERNPQLGLAIRKKMFTFEDLVRLDGQALQRIMREIDMRDLTYALKRASESLTTMLLSNISRRAAETVREEIAFLGNVKLKEVEAAQFRIIDAVRKLEAEGEIELDPEESGSEENVLV